MSTAAIILILAGGGVASIIFVVFYTAYQIFKHTLYRSPKAARTRDCAVDATDEQKQVFAEGAAWAENYRDITEELQIVSDGLNLVGEYVNFGNDKCAVIVQGRTESLLYSYYYADIYAKNGYNILVIDTRAHGLSDGKYITAGVKEHEDLILWIDLIKGRYSIASFLIHGICIGGATAIYAYCAAKEDRLVKRIVADGLYINYYEIFKNHHIEFNKPVLFFVYLTFFFVRVLSGADILKETPYRRMSEIDIPILFIWSSKDVYCKMEYCKKLFDACSSKYKEMKFFPAGGHSYVRFHNTEGYDEAIASFLET